jgi:hypothetical protein
LKRFHRKSISRKNNNPDIHSSAENTVVAGFDGAESLRTNQACSKTAFSSSIQLFFDRAEQNMPISEGDNTIKKTFIYVSIFEFPESC